MSADLGALKAAVPFPDLVLETHAVDRSGKVLCPVHDDHAPSCHVYPEAAHCYACGWHGDHIDWLEQVYGLTTAKAIRELERRAGGQVPPVAERPVRVRKPEPTFRPVDPEVLAEHHHRAARLDRVPTAMEGRGFNLNDLRRLQFAAHDDDAVFPITDPGGAVLALKRRYALPNGSRYGYVTTGCGSPAWCSPGFLEHDEVLVIEGELNAMACALVRSELGVMGVAGVNGPLYLPALQGRTVYCYGDGDEPGQRARDGWSQQALQAEASEVFVLEAWPMDACDLAGQDGRGTLTARLDMTMRNAKKVELIPAAALLPKIQTNHRPLRDITADALAALERANDPPFLFNRGTVPVRVSGEARAEALTAVSLKGILDRHADFVKVSSKTRANGDSTTDETPVRPPHDLAPDILALGALPFPRLKAIAAAPVALPGGTILSRDGFSAEHGILLRLAGLTNLRTDVPTAEAVARLRDVFGDFPFADPEAGFAHVLAMTLQPFVRPLISGPTPLYLIDAPARGTGKGLVSEVSSRITLGYPAPVMSQPRDGDELEKRITTVLLEGRQLVFFDNVTQLNSPHLAAAITAETWQGRVLGKSELVSVPNRAVWLATGNNVEISDEFARRIIPIRLDAGVERPEDRRGFRHKNLPEYVQAHRSELVSACLSLVQGWINEDMPKVEVTLGRFESWAGVIGGILEVSGVPGFLSGRERLYSDADSETKEWAALCGLWWTQYGDRPVSAKDLFDVLKEHGLLLDLWGARSAQAALQRIGRALSRGRDRVFGGYKIRTAGRDSTTKSNTYRLEKAAGKNPGNPGHPENTVTGSHHALGFFRGSESADAETPPKLRQNPGAAISVQDSVSTQPSGVSGVSGVIDRPAAEQSAPPKVRTLYERFKAGNFSDRPDLNSELTALFSRRSAGAEGKMRLLELAEVLL